LDKNVTCLNGTNRRNKLRNIERERERMKGERKKKREKTKENSRKVCRQAHKADRSVDVFRYNRTNMHIE
jgi:hypothetical protein